jgi:putative flippase GtrA
MPRTALLVFAAALTLAMVPGYPGALGIALIGAFSAAFALQGLAAFHDRSRGRPGRFALLAGLYVLLFLTQGVAMLALILFGIADTALDRRRPKPRGDA